MSTAILYKTTVSSLKFLFNIGRAITILLTCIYTIRHHFFCSADIPLNSSPSSADSVIL